MLWFLGLVSGCGQEPSALEAALDAAGNNRAELEKVLAYYSQNEEDSLKLRAARFLIENMPGHYTLRGKTIDEFRNRLDRDTAEYFARKTMDILLSEVVGIEPCPEREYDVRHITADYLIRHINSSMALYRRFPWYKNIPVEFFFRHVLPYRIDHERLDGWRDSLQPVLQEECIISSDVRQDINEARKYLNLKYDFGLTFSTSEFNEFYGQSQNECQYLYLRYLMWYRGLGLLYSMDYFPCYANRNGLHYWMANIDTQKTGLRVEKNPGNGRAAKVFRKTFERNPTVSPRKGEYVPPLFLDPFVKDVTTAYLKTKDIVVERDFETKHNVRFAYLCVFNNLRWIPTAIGRWNGNKVEFAGMGTGIVYLPVVFSGEVMNAFNYPFVLNASGDVEYLIPNEKKRVDLHLERKYPYDEQQFFYSAQFRGMTIEASNKPDFAQVDTLAWLPTYNYYYYSVELPRDAGGYRYWRFNPKGSTFLAEIILYDSQGNRMKFVHDSLYEKVYDGNPLTYILQDKTIIEFVRPESVARVVCLPRSDGNGIYPENRYELFYYTQEGWKSLGSKIATDYFMDYENVPTGCLYWLRNWTTGQEERVFTVDEDGEIHFW